MITGFQLRAAKATLGLTGQNISESIGIHQATIIRLCQTKNLDYLACNVKNLVLIQKFFEDRNIVFPTKDSISLKNHQGSVIVTHKMTRFQLKAARIATNLTQEELSFYIKISSSTLSILENSSNLEYIKSSKLNIPNLRKFFQHINITFPDDFTVTLTGDPAELVKKS